MQIQQQIDILFVNQRKHWQELDDAIKGMKSIQSKRLNWGNEIEVEIQYNPERIVSVASKVDFKSINKRPCFLCAKNRPGVQEGIEFLNKYIILTNPFPILNNHLTIALHSHVPQLIGRKVIDMLTLAENLYDYVIFYNGPKAGASAPDHFHFQAGLKHPILMSGDNELRSCLTIQSSNKEEAINLFYEVIYYLESFEPDAQEPMMNIIAFYENDKYNIHIYPRKQHRPRQYFLEGSQQILISPGAVDIAGLIITPRFEDFEKINKEDIEDIYQQVSRQII